jgi:chromate reductase, NAD(P)H dehydrogenase (quinone)
MATLIGISGSLRKGSYNTMLLNAASAMMPEGDELIRWNINGIPLYDGDLEAMEGIPTAVTELKDAITTADGLLIATPEYNNSMPGVLKNVIDWLSRPPADIDRVFGEKPVAVIGASLGGLDDPKSECMAPRIADIGNPSMVRRPPDGIPCTPCL